MNDTPETVASAQAVLDALQRTAPALALVDAGGTLRWCSASFVALFPAAAQSGLTLQALLGDTALAGLAGGAVDLIVGDGSPGARGPWRLRAAALDEGGRLISAEPLAGLRAAEAHARNLQDRLDLVQSFTRTGVFERDPVTMQGRWDRQMYRNWCLPEPPLGEPSPPYEQISRLMFSEDRSEGDFAASLKSPGMHSQRMRVRGPDGQVRYLHSQWNVTHDAQGRPLKVLGVNTDDTALYELINSAEQLRTELAVALTVGHIALWRHDLATGRVHFDERGCEIVGIPYTEQGITLAQSRALIHPDDLWQSDASRAQTLRSGEPSDMELRYPRPGGGWRHVLSRRALQRGPEGQPLGFVGVLMDVTERVLESGRALAIARRLETAAEAARVGLWSSEAGSPLPSWNRRMFELFGLDPSAQPLPLDDWLQRCVHPADRVRVQDTVRDWWRAGEGGREIELRILRPGDGAVRWLVVRGEMTRVGDNGMRRAEGVAIDITEQQRTLRQLRETVERMTLTTRALGLGTWRANRGHLEIIWDAQMFRLRGIDSPTRRIVNDEIASCVHPDDRAQIMSDQIGRVADSQPWQHVFRIVRPDGQVRQITSQSVAVYDEAGQPDGRIGINWDSTEAHLAALAIREREVAVAESQAKSQAMSRISHELRTPLNAMLGFTQLLRGAPTDTWRDPDSERRARWLAHVEDAGRHLLALIDDVLELSRAEVGELKLAKVAVACAAVVDAALPLVAGTAQERGVVLRRERTEGLVLADPVRLRQVLINLLSNGIKYNRRGGEVRLWSRQQGDTVTLHVSDNGIGIAPERLRHAFEPFNRLGAEATGVEGSGIGLAIVKVLVEHMGGQVEARSQPGQGSEFIVRLPAAPTAPSAIGAPAPTAAPVANGAAAAVDTGALRVATSPRVLYIEDNAVNALLVSEMLAHRPALTLEIAVDGRSGVRRARETLPALILVDMQLPDIDGHAVLAALRADPLTAGIRCVALSANATQGDVDAARAAGFVDYWTKPIEFRRFLDGVDGLLGRLG